MNTLEVTLHGGPMHGKRVALSSETSSYIRIVVPVEDPAPLGFTGSGAPSLEDGVPVRYGRYSRVGGFRGDFEWDGFEVSP